MTIGRYIAFEGAEGCGKSTLASALVGAFEAIGVRAIAVSIDDFYLTHSSFDYAPGLLIWHSRDLINWRPVAAALHRYYGTVWAPYLCEYQNHFYLYFPAAGSLKAWIGTSPTCWNGERS